MDERRAHEQQRAGNTRIIHYDKDSVAVYLACRVHGERWCRQAPRHAEPNRVARTVPLQRERSAATVALRGRSGRIDRSTLYHPRRDWPARRASVRAPQSKGRVLNSLRERTRGRARRRTERKTRAFVLTADRYARTGLWIEDYDRTDQVIYVLSLCSL